MNVVKNHNLECSPIFLVELLHESSLVFLVGLEEAKDFSPYKVTMWSTSENLVIYTSPKFNSKIQAIKLNKKRMLVLERNLLHIFNFSDMKIIHSLEVNNLSTAHIVISHCIENDNIFCYSHFADQGLIKVYDLFSLYLKHTIRAHKSKVGRLSINHKGDMVASCSEKGTIIRIFSIITGDKLYTFKRGISSTIIYSMCFNKINNQILVTSENGTVHLFLLEKK
jgi:autophagy-related protein 18